jgi:hypothetical protein
VGGYPRYQPPALSMLHFVRHVLCRMLQRRCDVVCCVAAGANGERIHIGFFEEEEAAAHAYDQMVREQESTLPAGPISTNFDVNGNRGYQPPQLKVV